MSRGDFGRIIPVNADNYEIFTGMHFSLLSNEEFNKSVYFYLPKPITFALNFTVCIWDNPIHKIKVETKDHQGNIEVIQNDKIGGYWKITTDQFQWYPIYIEAA